MLVRHVTDLADLLGARTLSHASAKLGHVEWDAKAFGIFSPRAYFLGMPSQAGVSLCRVRFSSRARVSERAAVRMDVKNVLLGANRATWRCLEAHRKDCASMKIRLYVRIVDRLKPHNCIIIVFLVVLHHLCIGWGQVLSVHDAWNLKRWVLDIVGWGRLVERIKADDIGIISKSS